MSRTYKADAFLKARDEWESFGPEWDRIRAAAAQSGYIFPPSGTELDDRDAESPSQRAIVYRALMDRPRETEAIVRRSSSWSEVVTRIFDSEARRRAEVVEEHHGDTFRRRTALPKSLADIFREMAG